MGSCDEIGSARRAEVGTVESVSISWHLSYYSYVG